MSPLQIRPATPEDADRIAVMANALNGLHDMDATVFTAEKVRRDGFGPGAAFSCLLAEREGVVVGYAMFHDCYNSDLAARGMWLVDLYVDAHIRGAGIGRKLLAALAREALARGAMSLWWGVKTDNTGARAMYANLGAQDWDYRILEFDRADLERVADRE